MENDAPVVGRDAPIAKGTRPTHEAGGVLASARRAASIVPMSIFFIVIIASKGRFCLTATSRKRIG